MPALLSNLPRGDLLPQPDPAPNSSRSQKTSKGSLLGSHPPPASAPDARSAPPAADPHSTSNHPATMTAGTRGDEEFDFDDVFGPAPTHALDPSMSSQVTSAGHSSNRASTNGAASHGRDDEIEQDEHLQQWAPADSIADSSSKPFVICHRSHSMVGPVVTPRHSLLRCTSNSKAAGGKDEANGAPSSYGSAGRSPADRLDAARLAGGRSAADMANASSGSMSRFRGGGEAEEEEIRREEEAMCSEGCSCVYSCQDSAGRRSCGKVAAGSGSICNSGGKTHGCVGGAGSGGPCGEDSWKVGPDSFEMLMVVGQGAFGKVFQVQKKDTGEVFAMKVMRKDRILARNHGDYMKSERDILTRVVEHPFIVQLQYSFQTQTKLYLLLDFVNGGHLFFQLYRQGTFNEDLARLYTAELVLAVGHLHSLGIMHRDLKPENILLDCDGHIRLTDFGLAKDFAAVNDKSNSLCGTMEYMAPEIIQAKGHGPAADYWSIGVLLYEMLTGQPPFCCGNRQKLQQKIIKDKIKWPSYITSEAQSLLKGLLQKDPSRRLGSGEGGLEAVKGHKWFRVLNWDKLLRREVQPKFRPMVNGKHCTANFDEMWTKMPVNDSPAGTPTSPSVFDSAVFRNYSFVAPHHRLQQQQHSSQLSTVDSDSDREGEDEEDEEEEDCEDEDVREALASQA